jgi:phosphonate transport system substrate-binding protein
MSQPDILRVGAVAYDPKVVTIWEGFKAYFDRHGTPIDYILYSNYESQVAANLAGEIDVAWNSPLAWVRSQIQTGGHCKALAMRDSDRDLTTKIIASKRSGITSLQDLRGKTVAVGASDSPQATLIPLSLIAVGGERDAARALAASKADVACVLDANYNIFVNEGTLDPGTTVVVASTPPFDHCNFTANPDLDEGMAKRFLDTLHSMSFSDPEIRTYMELEGLRQWLPARLSGYAQLEKAVKRISEGRLAAAPA